MTWSERVDRAFALRREELLSELVEDGKRVIEGVDAVVDSVATRHPLAYVGTGVAAGAWMTMMRGSRGLSVLRLISLGAGLLG